MAVFRAFAPITDPATGDMTAVNKTTGGTSANTPILGDEVRIKALTQPAYIRMGGSSVTVSAANGYYMAVGDETTWLRTDGATHLAYIQVGSAGALSIIFGEAN